MGAAVVRVVVTRRQRERAEHDPPLHFRAEAFAARVGVDLGERAPVRTAPSIANAVEAREVRARLGVGHDVVDRDRVADRRHARLFDDRAHPAQRRHRRVEVVAHFAGQLFERLAHDAETHAAHAGVEIGGVIVDRLRARR